MDYLLLPFMPSPFRILSGELICLSLTIRWQGWRKFLIYPCKTCGNVIIFRRATRIATSDLFAQCQRVQVWKSASIRLDLERIIIERKREKKAPSQQTDTHFYGEKFKSKTFTQIQQRFYLFARRLACEFFSFQTICNIFDEFYFIETINLN